MKGGTGDTLRALESGALVTVWLLLLLGLLLLMVVMVTIRLLSSHTGRLLLLLLTVMMMMVIWSLGQGGRQRVGMVMVVSRGEGIGVVGAG